MSSSFSVDEVVETIRRSSLPTVVTEGVTDYFVYRRLESLISDSGASFLPVGGRSNVLDVFARRADMAGGNVAFVIDMDMWLFSGQPNEFQSDWIATTHGYSIENDLYADGDWERLLDHGERGRFQRDLGPLSDWFSREVDIYLSGGAPVIDLHPDRILDNAGTLLADLEAARQVSTRSQATFDQVRGDYARLVRGKTLLNLLIRHLSYPGRGARHNTRSLMEMAAVVNGALMTRLAQQIRQALATPLAVA